MFHQKMKTAELNRTGTTIRCTQSLTLKSAWVPQPSSVNQAPRSSKWCCSVLGSLAMQPSLLPGRFYHKNIYQYTRSNERTFFFPSLLLLPFYLSHSTPQGHCWPPHCGPAYTLLWFSFERGPSTLFKLTKSQGAPGILRPCFTHTHFPCCTQEGVFLWSSQLRKMFEPFLSKDSHFGYCNILSCGLAENHPDTFVFFQNAAMKILSAPCCFDHIPLPCFSFAVTSVSHIQNKRCALSSRFFSWLTSNSNITSPATKMYFYSAMALSPLNLYIWKPNKHVFSYTGMQRRDTLIAGKLPLVLP